MADRYWVLGTGSWSSTNTVNWSATSGGAGGASVPTAADNVFFDANSNVLATAFTVTMANSPRVCNDFTASGLDGTMTLAGSSGTALNVSGSLFFPTTNFNRTYLGLTTFNATTTGRTVTTNGATLTTVTFNGIGGEWALGSALSGTIITLTNGTLDLNGKTCTATNRFVTAAGTKNLTFNGGILVCSNSATNAFNNAAPTNFTTTAGTGTGTISMTAASAKTFVGGGSTFNCTLNQGGAGTLTITGSNTFSDITNTVQPASVLFTGSTTNTFTNFSLSGTAGNLITIGSNITANHTLSKASGTVSSDFLSISRSTATGGAGWYAGANSTDGGNNTGWSFAAAPALVLSGNQATGAVGTLLADRSIQEDGTIATGNVGTVGISRAVDITGNAATCAVGSVLAESTQAITGNASTLSVGSVTQSAAIDLVGNASTAAVGTVGLTSTKAITGNAAAGDVGTVLAEVISFQAITGVEGTGAVGTASNVISIGIIGVESICAVGIMIGFGWGSIPNTSETWTPEADTSESWTPVANSTESWTPASDTSESWSDLADNSITWQEAA